jgi:geranylgeranyl diphosphate synthase type I
LSTSEILIEENAARALREVWQAVEPRLRFSVEELRPPFPVVAGYHLGWCDAAGEPSVAGGGKAIRPAMTLLACEAVGGSRTGAIDAAAAVELVHNFSLVHDDVIDHDTERRHRETVWSVFGVPVAILTGNVLLILAQQLLLRSGHQATGEALAELNRAVQRMLHGQMLDIGFESRLAVEPEECLLMVEGKTAALIECACVLGALHAGADDATKQALRDMGRHLGMAFQYVDDLLGIWGDPRRTGKPVWSDLRSRKKSLPVVAALSGGTAAGRELARLYAQTDPLTDEHLADAADLVEEAGGRDWARAAAGRHLDEALSHLRSARPVPEAERDLSSIAHLIVDRDV